MEIKSIETLIHTPDGKFKIDKGPITRFTSLEDIELSEKEIEEIEHKHRVLLAFFKALARHDRLWNNRVLNLYNYYRRLKKLNCIEVDGLRYVNGYLRAKVCYPDGIERTWWCGGWSGWQTNGATRAARRRAMRR